MDDSDMDRDAPRKGSLRGTDRGLVAGYGIVANVLLADRDLPPVALKLYLILQRYAYSTGEAWPGQARLALELGLSRRSVQHYIAVLRDRGLIAVEGPSDIRSTNTYSIVRLEQVYDDNHIEWASKIRSLKELRERFPADAARFADDDEESTIGLVADEESQPCGEESCATPTQNPAPPLAQNPAPDGVLIVKHDEGKMRAGARLTPRAGKSQKNGTHPVGDKGLTYKSLKAGDLPTKRASADLGGARTVVTKDDEREPPEPEPEAPKVERPPPKNENAAPPSPAKSMASAVIPVSSGLAETTDRKLWPADSPEKLCALWAAEMQLCDEKFVAPRATPSDIAVAKLLLKVYRPEFSGDLLLAMIRLAIWDWPAIQASVETWYTAKKKFPTLQVIYKLATTLAGATESGFTAPPAHRSSVYRERWFTGSGQAEPKVGTVTEQAKRDGKTRAEVMLERMEEKQRRVSG